MAKSQIPDALLVQMYISGDESALEKLVKRHQSKLFGFIYSKLGDRELADDFFQETFIKVVNTLKSQKQYDEKGKFLSWVMRIANNLIIDHYRKSKKVQMCRDTEEYSVFSIIKDNSPSIESLMISDQISFDVLKLIDELPIDQQEVVRMRFFQEMSFKEIAEATNVSLNTSLGRMRYALQNLRKIIEKKQIYLTA